MTLMRSKSRSRAAVALVVASVVGLQGCVTSGSVKIPGVIGVPRAEAGDSCAPLRQPLLDKVDEYNQRFALNVGVGAVAGGVTGGVVAKQTGNNVGVGVLIGVVGGAMLGLLKNYYDRRFDQAGNNAEVLRTLIDDDISAATQSVNSVSSSVTALNQCRLDQLEDLRQRILQGGQGEAERAELEAIRRRAAQDQELVSTVVGDINTGNQVYAEAYQRSNDVAETQMLRRSAAYTPKTRGSALPKIDTRSAPRGANAADTLFIEARELNAQSDAQKDYIEEEFDAIDALLA